MCVCVCVCVCKSLRQITNHWTQHYGIKTKLKYKKKQKYPPLNTWQTPTDSIKQQKVKNEEFLKLNLYFY